MALLTAREPAGSQGRWRVFSAFALLVALAPSAYLAWMARDLPYLGQYQDDAIYWNAARSLAEGGGYRITSLPGQPFETKYPPLFPLALAAICRLYPTEPASLHAAMLLAWILLPACVLLAMRLSAGWGLAPWQKLVLAMAVALHPAAAILSTNLLADLAFCSLAFLSLIVAERAGQGDSGPRACVAGICGGLAYLTRSAALALVISEPVYFLIKKRRRAAFLSLAGSLPALLAWEVWVHLHRNPAPDLLYYTDYLGFRLHNVLIRDLPAMVARNVVYLVRSSGSLIVFNLYGSQWERFLAAVLGLIAIVGVVRLAQQCGLRQYHIFAAAYAAMLVAWHYPPNERFLFPLMPALMAGFLAELTRFGGALYRSWRESRPRIVLFVFAAPILLVAGCALSTTVDALAKDFPAYIRQQRQFRVERDQAYGWIRQNTPATASFLAYYDVTLYLYTGRHARRPEIPLMPFYRGDREESVRMIRGLADFAREHELAYYFFTPADFHWEELLPEERRMVQLVLRGSGDFEQVYARDGIEIYRVRQRAAGAGAHLSAAGEDRGAQRHGKLSGLGS